VFQFIKYLNDVFLNVAAKKIAGTHITTSRKSTTFFFKLHYFTQ